MSTTWEKLPALPGRNNPCLCCPPIGARLHMEDAIMVGFGDAHVEKDGETVYREPGMYEGMKDCSLCNGVGYMDAAFTVLCGACGGLGKCGK